MSPVGVEDLRVLYVRRLGGRFRILDAATDRPAISELGLLDQGGKRRKADAYATLRIRDRYNAACRSFADKTARSAE